MLFSLKIVNNNLEDEEWERYEMINAQINSMEIQQQRKVSKKGKGKQAS